MTALTAAHAQDFDFQEVSYSPRETRFQLFAPPTAPSVKVRLYQDGQGGKALKTVRMKYRDGLWQATVKGDHRGRFYTFDTGRGECPGVFAKAVGVNGRRGAIIDLRTTDPEGWEHDRRPPLASAADQVIYELHHRDFSVARPDARYPGKFLALTEPWAIDHLTRLGVTAVHILPSYDFGSIDETRLDPSSPDYTPQYNWGYDPVNYNVPEGSYSTDPYRPEVRIREFKRMVQALHRAGIRVVLDVVYNHTYDIEHSNFQRTYADYYYRTTPTSANPSQGGGLDSFDATGNDHGKTGKPVQYSNGSGCGNETASEQPMMRRFMVESVKYWIQEYHIDGLRFDLMGCHDIETMNTIRRAVDEIDPSIFIYGEGWSAGACGLPNDQLGMKANISRMPRIAAFSDELRDALRGPFSDDTKGGFLTGVADCEESLKYGIVGCISHPQVDMTKVNYSQEPWAAEPTQMVSYVSCHDDMCLVDRLRATVGGKGRMDDRTISQLDMLAQTAVLTSQGVPFLLSGEEMLRDKKGVHNSFESPDSVNQLPWQNMERYPQVFDYYSRLIALRRHHPAFRLGSADLVRRHLTFLDAPRQVVAFQLSGHAGGDRWESIIVVLNASPQAQTIRIPDGTWTAVVRDGVIDEQGVAELRGPELTVSGRSAVVVHN